MVIYMFTICVKNFPVRVCTEIFVLTVHKFVLCFPRELIFYIFLKYIY